MKAKTDSDKSHDLERLLNDARAEADELRSALQVLEQIVTSTRLIMGHELKKPTTAIVGYLDLALEELDPSATEVIEYITKARGECGLLNELNLFFLELLKMDKEQEKGCGGSVNLRRFVTDVLNHCPKNLNAQDRVRVRITPQALDFRINANAFKIILSNIIENALYYSPKEAPVIVEIEKEPDRRRVDEQHFLKIRVMDHGKGIPEPYVQKIFSPFVRLHNRAEGSGLGLTLVRSLVELYGGQVYIRSNSFEGSTVYLTIPEAAEKRFRRK